MKIYSALFVWLFFMLAAAVVQAEDTISGARHFKLCSGCHGFMGEGNELVRAPPLAGLENWYLQRQIQNFRDGIRGGDDDDAHGRLMALMAQGIAADEMVNLLAYVRGLPMPETADTLSGDLVKGKALYATCAACHGQAGEGNKEMHAPALANTSDWYQQLQLTKFREGKRGSHPSDHYGRQMAQASKLLPDEQAVTDVVAYINELTGAP